MVALQDETVQERVERARLRDEVHELCMDAQNLTAQAQQAEAAHNAEEAVRLYRSAFDQYDRGAQKAREGTLPDSEKSLLYGAWFLAKDNPGVVELERVVDILERQASCASTEDKEEPLREAADFCAQNGAFAKASTLYERVASRKEVTGYCNGASNLQATVNRSAPYLERAAQCARRADDLTRARALATKAVALYENLGGRLGTGDDLVKAADVAQEFGLDESARLCRRAFDIYMHSGQYTEAARLARKRLDGRETIMDAFESLHFRNLDRAYAFACAAEMSRADFADMVGRVAGAVAAGGGSPEYFFRKNDHNGMQKWIPAHLS